MKKRHMSMSEKAWLEERALLIAWIQELRAKVACATNENIPSWPPPRPIPKPIP